MSSIHIISPPFVEPGIPSPDIHRVSSLISDQNVEAHPIDLNVRLFRELLSDIPEVANLDIFDSCVRRALFVDESNQFEILGGEQTTESTFIRLKQVLINEAIPFFSQRGKSPNHSNYVRYTEVLNCFLDYSVKQISPDLSLWLDKLETGVDITSQEQALKYIRNQNNAIFRLYDKYLIDEIFKIESKSLLIVISNQEQQLPGMVLAAWLKSRTEKKIIMNGHHLDIIFNLHYPKNIFDICDEIVAYPIEYSVSEWLKGDQHPFVLRKGQNLFPEYKKLPAAEAMNVFRFSDINEYFSPFPVAGLLTTSRCYWSQCTFCSLSRDSAYGFKQISTNTILGQFEYLNNNTPIRYVQFFDYAMPLKVLRALCNRKLDRISWAGQLRFENGYLEDGFFEKMYSSGCRALAWGLESGSMTLLKKMNKGGNIRSEDRSEILRRSASSGILNHLFLIVGHPDESEADFILTLNFLADNIDYIGSVEAHEFQNVPGTLDSSPNEDDEGAHSKRYMAWNLDNNIRNKDQSIIVKDRCHFLKETFRPIEKKYCTNDLLSGHMVFIDVLRRNRN